MNTQQADVHTMRKFFHLLPEIDICQTSISHARAHSSKNFTKIPHHPNPLKFFSKFCKIIHRRCTGMQHALGKEFQKYLRLNGHTLYQRKMLLTRCEHLYLIFLIPTLRASRYRYTIKLDVPLKLVSY